MQVRSLTVDAQGWGCGAEVNGREQRWCLKDGPAAEADEGAEAAQALATGNVVVLFFLVLFSDSGVSQNYKMHESPSSVVVLLHFVSGDPDHAL